MDAEMLFCAGTIRQTKLGPGKCRMFRLFCMLMFFVVEYGFVLSGLGLGVVAASVFFFGFPSLFLSSYLPRAEKPKPEDADEQMPVKAITSIEKASIDLKLSGFSGLSP